MRHALVNAYARGYRSPRRRLDNPFIAGTDDNLACLLGWLDRQRGVPANPPASGREARTRYEATRATRNLLAPVERQAVDASAKGPLL